VSSRLDAPARRALSLVTSAVNEHIRGNPVAYRNWTNSQIAAANRISVREVKSRIAGHSLNWPLGDVKN